MTTLTSYLDLQWSISTSPGVITAALGATAIGTVVEPWKGNYQLDTPHTATTVVLEEDLGSPATPNGTIPDFTPLADFNGGLALWFAGDYYYRIWVVPVTLRVQNPQLGVPIPFHLWNAYPWHNYLESYTSSGDTGLTLSVTPPTLFKEIEYKEIDITIDATAPINISATYHFVFDYGSGDFFFQATIADFVQMVPDIPVSEYWDWLSDVMASYDSTEQRVGIRSSPRRSIAYSFVLENDLDRRKQYNRWYKSLATELLIPYYQYATALTADVAIGDTRIYFDPNATDVREGEFGLILNRSTEQASLIKFDTLLSDGAIVSSPMQAAYKKRDTIAPAFPSRLANKTGLAMRSVTGKISVQAEVLTAREQFTRPGSTATISTFYGYNVLDRRPLAMDDVDENFDINYEIIDSESGVETIKHSWKHTFADGPRKYHIPRQFNPGEMDFWRDFLSAACGQQGAFLTPTYRQDIILAEEPEVGLSILTINFPEYNQLYFPYETYKYLQIETASGMLWRKVISATDQADGTTILELDDNITDVVQKISFLNLVRLNSDRVTLTHSHVDTILEISLRTVDA